jgi:hypothetical protein
MADIGGAGAEQILDEFVQDDDLLERNGGFELEVADDLAGFVPYAPMLRGGAERCTAHCGGAGRSHVSFHPWDLY